MDAEREAWEVLNSSTWCQYVCSADYAECGCRQTIAAALRQARAAAIEECARVADRACGTPEATVMARSLAGQIRRLASPTEADHG